MSLSNILLDYVFNVAEIEATPQASTAFLRQVLVLVKPKEGVEPEIVEITAPSQIATYTDNTEVAKLFSAGMAKVYLLPTDSLEVANIVDDRRNDFYTVLVSSDFSKEEFLGEGEVVEVVGEKSFAKINDILFRAIEAGTDGDNITIELDDTVSAGPAAITVEGTAITIDFEEGVHTMDDIAEAINGHPQASILVEAIVDFGDGEKFPEDTDGAVSLSGGVDEVTGSAGDGIDLGLFSGVVGFANSDLEFLEDQSAISKRSVFYNEENEADNMFLAFGKLLSNLSNWRNQQYIQSDSSDGVSTLGEANSLYDERIGFFISDAEFGNRLGMFATGKKAIIAPYVKKNLTIDIQSRAIQYFSLNQPQYNMTSAKILEGELQKIVDQYIERRLIDSGEIKITLVEQNFRANAVLTIAEPSAFWRVSAELISEV